MIHKNKYSPKIKIQFSLFPFAQFNLFLDISFTNWIFPSDSRESYIFACLVFFFYVRFSFSLLSIEKAKKRGKNNEKIRRSKNERQSCGEFVGII